MKCNNVRKEIDLWIYHNGPDPGAEFYRHLESCKKCALYLEETRIVAGKIDGLRRREPVLKDPEGLTEDIMNAIREDSGEIHHNITRKSRRYMDFIILRRLLAAASVCLFLMFAYEEYVVVDKISALEKQNAMISQNSQYKTALMLKKAISILASDPEMLKQYKELKTSKINLRTLLRAAMYADVAGFTPDDFKLLNRAGNDPSNASFISVLKKFDSTLHTK